MDLLLHAPTSRHLYHDIAENLPIIDYQCHLSPRDVALDRRFRSITELWLENDPLKWRAMRSNGVDERYITGDASDWEKFEKWAETLPYAFRNPLYNWSRLELSSAFDITEPLNPRSARKIYDRCNEMLQSPEMSARGLLQLFNVETLCTTDDPVDTLEWHSLLKKEDYDVCVLPSWAPDKVLGLDAPDYLAYIGRLERASGLKITSYESLIQALQVRHDFFAKHGCVISHLSLGEVPQGKLSPRECDKLSRHVLDGDPLLKDNLQKMQLAILVDLARMNHAKGWAQQIHFGTLFNVNTRMCRLLGPGTGFDTIGDGRNARAMAHFLDILDRDQRLAKTILSNLNPADNTWVAAMLANFQDSTIPGKIQMGTAWWYNNNFLGMQAQMNALSTQGLFSRFIGMVTNARSFISFPRHEYFRRILCRMIGSDVEAGVIPLGEEERVEQMIADISYYNVKRYLGL
ncbi:MAG: glucuronate isomerase [Bacteroidales bacterium]|nr:glucuronate isomerase [Bacteroidales bacterium]